MEIKALICAESPLDAPQAGSSRLSFNIRGSDSDFTRPRGGFTVVTKRNLSQKSFGERASAANLIVNIQLLEL